MMNYPYLGDQSEYKSPRYGLKIAAGVGAAFAVWLISAVASHAADFPVKASPAPVYAPVPFAWTSFYAFVNIGGGFGDLKNDVNTVIGGGSFSSSTSGFMGGGGIGAQKQWGNLVVGVEARLNDFAPSATVNAAIAGAPAALTANADLVYAGLLTAGLTFGDGSWLIAAEGGVAGSKANVNLAALGTSLVSNNTANIGWVAGVKLEKGVQLFPGVAGSLSLEYLHYDISGIDQSFLGNEINISNKDTIDYVGVTGKVLFN